MKNYEARRPVGNDGPVKRKPSDRDGPRNDTADRTRRQAIKTVLMEQSWAGVSEVMVASVPQISWKL